MHAIIYESKSEIIFYNKKYKIQTYSFVLTLYKVKNGLQVFPSNFGTPVNTILSIYFKVGVIF